ncbi:hypothetical protein [Malacoplasma iowae]|uniref:Uncharacterized protein n=2 Tax=Malacoplasma iowae TaxID=2116 RepID=A0A6P1LNH7_MALIO|nr:hypothetical protein [Malacoplasma iowae]QHG90072.1 hypothetical protein EER00_04245 [Malacoplasma iowae 695]WPL36195.1 hypothetical protein QX180_02120 [Malacoplasma iowae]VEU61901.1 Uncharacterised protein [Mycoplasmopsis fermentans]VEU70856.1 Uncharacterised protein [Malacoplasma iowae]
MKIKLLKTIGIIGCLGIVGATPVMLTSCKKKSTSQSATITPQLKTKITGVGGLDEFITTSSKADDVNKNLNDVLNNNMESVISNWESIPENERNNIKIDSTLSGWDNTSWGDKTFDQWSEENTSTTVQWKGSKTEVNDKEKVDFKSNKELKEFLNSNIVQISKNAIDNLGNKKPSLADADIKVTENGNLLVAIKVTEGETEGSNRLKRDVSATTTNYTLSIPSELINFDPTINLQVSYGNNQSISTEVVFNYTVTSSSLIEQTFTESANKKTITLAEMSPTESDTIGLWKTVTDEGILKALGWLDINESLEEGHKDGDGIDVGLLKEDTIISDLGIDGLTKEKLLGIEIQMDQRDISQTNYNGEYSILVSTIGDNSESVDLNLSFNTYKIVSQKTSNNTQHPLQVNVPNAYYTDNVKSGTDTNLVTNINLTKENFKGQLKLKDTNESNAGSTFIKSKFENNSASYREFIKKLDESGLNMFKYVNLEFTDVVVSEENNTDKSNDNTNGMYSGNIIKLKVTTKKGFSFKKSFTNNSIQYNKNTSGDLFLYISFTYKNQANYANSSITFGPNVDGGGDFQFIPNSNK